MQFTESKKTAVRSNQAPHFRIKTWISALALGWAVLSSPIAMANEAEEVSKLMRENRYDQALARAEAYLATSPGDAQMRFLKGLILTERNKESEAINVFIKLTEDFPELPEPYNNLAVLYASKGEYDKAREALEMAIRTHPSYATAYENLGDVYAKLASQSYDKALQLDGRNATAQTKLSMVRRIIKGESPAYAAQPPVQIAQAPEPAPAPAAKAPAPVKAPPPPPSAKVEQPPSISLPPISSEVASNSPAINSVPSTTQPEPKLPPTQTIGADRQVLSAVERWAKAWSDQDMASYLDSYSQDFVPPRGMNRAAWETQRERRIVGKDRIRVVVDNPLITLTGDTAVVKFKQSYFSDRLNNVANKTLTLKLEGTQWRITNEQVDG